MKKIVSAILALTVVLTMTACGGKKEAAVSMDVNAVYESYFISKPARSCVAVKALPKGVLCEIEAIAVK